MTLADHQREFNGLTLGDQTPYNIIEESGLEGFSVRSGTRPIPRDDGAIPGLHLADQKTVVIPVEVVGDPETVVEPAVNAAEAAFVPQRTEQLQYRFKNPGDDERFVWARPVRFRRTRNAETTVGVDGFQVALELADPRIYSVAELIEGVPIFEASGGGADLPADLPLDMTAATQELGTAINEGSGRAYPVVRFQFPSGGSGTVTGVELTNLTTGVVLDVDTTLVAGQTLTADMDALIRATGDPVIHIAGVSRYGDWVPPREPLFLAPGSNSLRFEVTGTSTDPVAVVTWRHTN